MAETLTDMTKKSEEITISIAFLDEKKYIKSIFHFAKIIWMFSLLKYIEQKINTNILLIFSNKTKTNLFRLIFFTNSFRHKRNMDLSKKERLTCKAIVVLACFTFVYLGKKFGVPSVSVECIQDPVHESLEYFNHLVNTNLGIAQFF